MYYKLILGVLMACAIASCTPSGHENDNHDEHETTNHNHETENQGHEAIKFQYTAYTESFELFAEADAFIAGETANVLAHFSTLPDFKALEKGKISVTLSVNGNTVQQTLEQPTRKGIYSFDIQPETAGTGELRFEISNQNVTYSVVVPAVTVFSNDHEAHEASESSEVSHTNTTAFTKEQSWKTNFATALPGQESLGQVIRTTAIVQSALGNEMVISAKTNGIVLFNTGIVLEGSNVSAGQSLFTVSGSSFSDNNIGVKYAEAKSNYDKAVANYERAVELAKDRIVSEKDLLAAKNEYLNAKAVYDNLSSNFNASGQTVNSPQSGFIKQIFVKNGTYIEAGQPVIVISQNKLLVLHAEVPLRYAPVLANINTANIRVTGNSKTWSLEELNGKVLSYGKSATDDNYLLPVTLQVENNGNLVPGSFVELFLKSYTGAPATLIVPSSSLMEEQGVFFVWVQITPELFEKREVSIGGTDGVNTEITNGITSDERIVTRGAILIKLSQATGSLDAHSGHVH